MVIKDLQSHSAPYVTVAELAAYWLVGRKQIYKQIDAGTLPAIQLGPRLLRIRKSDAQAFERSAKMGVSQETPRSKTAWPAAEQVMKAARLIVWTLTAMCAVSACTGTTLQGRGEPVNVTQPCWFGAH